MGWRTLKAGGFLIGKSSDKSPSDSLAASVNRYLARWCFAPRPTLHDLIWNDNFKRDCTNCVGISYESCVAGSAFTYRSTGPRSIDADERDKFGHRDYAAAVVSALGSQPRDPSHFTLGLFGPWGSGKSTILDEVEKRLTADTTDVKTAFILFDAWRYEGDSLRREFLKASACSLCGSNVLDETVAKKVTDTLEADTTTQEDSSLRLFNLDLWKRATTVAVIISAILIGVIVGAPKLGAEKETVLQILLAISSALAAFGLLSLQPIAAPSPIQKTRRRLEHPDEFTQGSERSSSPFKWSAW